MIELVTALSDHLITGLDAAGYPPLAALPNGQAGRILIGRRHNFEQYTPPRVVIMPVASNFGPRSNSLGAVRVSENIPRWGAEARRVLEERALFTDEMTFEVACWGIASADVFDEDGPDADFEYTRALYLQVIASLHALMPGNYSLGKGTWRDVRHVKRIGREFVFTVTIDVPVLDELTPIYDGAIPGQPIVTDTLEPVITDAMVIGTGDSSPGCEEPED